MGNREVVTPLCRTESLPSPWLITALKASAVTHRLRLQLDVRDLKEEARRLSLHLSFSGCFLTNARVSLCSFFPVPFP